MLPLELARQREGGARGHALPSPGGPDRKGTGRGSCGRLLKRKAVSIHRISNSPDSMPVMSSKPRKAASIELASVSLSVLLGSDHSPLGFCLISTCPLSIATRPKNREGDPTKPTLFQIFFPRPGGFRTRPKNREGDPTKPTFFFTLFQIFFLDPVGFGQQ